MTIAKTSRLIAAVALCAVSQVGWTVFDPVNDDTDIFLANPTITAERPNVLIFVDNTANWNTAFDTEKAALSSVINQLDDTYNVGFGMFVETGSPNDTVDGSYIRFGIRQMTSTNKLALAGMVSAFDKLGDKGNNATYSLAMGEMYRYFAGVSSYSGFGKVKRDYKGNSAYNSAAAGLPGNPFTSAASSTYVSPITSPCQKNFIIFISNGPAADNQSSLTIAQNHLATLVGKNPPDTITITPNGEQGLWADEYAKFMANSDCAPSIDGVQNVLTYTIDVLPGSSGQGPSHTALLKSMASNGKGKYCAVTDVSTVDQLVACLKSMLQEVQAVNSVFASTTLPVSVNVRGTNLNQVYIGVFRPDANKSPRWLGNLKLYKLGVNSATGSLFLADATGAPAENASTGFITGSATSYWTTASSYWAFRDPTLNGVGGSSDSPDGDLVEKGGAAQRLRLAYPASQISRALYTCVNGALNGPCTSGTSLSTMPFDNTEVTAGDLGAFTTYAVTSLASTSTTATFTLAAAPSPAWSVGDTIKIDGAGPPAYNGTYTLTSANNTTFTYTYTLPAALDSSTARASATNHGLQTGDLVTVSGAANATFNVTDAVVDRRDANTFRYPAVGVTGTNGAMTVTGKKLVTSLTAPGGLGPTATAVIPSHGYGTTGTVTLTFSGATPVEFNNGGAATTATIVDANTVTYVVTSSLTGTGATGRATAGNHGYANNQSITIQGASPSAYNTTATISVIDANTFTYPLNGTALGAATGSPILALVPIKYITHPNTGGGQDTATVTLYAAHGWTDNQALFIVGTGQSGYDAATLARTITNATANQSAGMFDMAARTNNEIKNAPVCLKASSTDPDPSGFSGACTVQPGMYAGRQITALVPIVQATGTIYAGKSISVQSLSALTTATGAITAGRPQDSSATVRDQIIAWVRGADNMENEDPATDTLTPGPDIRPSVHGDVLHSRPAVVNYNRYGDDNDIYAFYGSNDGIFHALKGGTANHTTGPDTAINPGSERWGFIPREFFSKLKRLRDQSPSISNVNQKDYFADGSIGIYQKDAKGNGSVSSPLNCIPGSCGGADTVSGVIGDNIHAVYGDKVYVYMSMRRGGTFMYALDVTNPATPKLLWRKSSSDAGWEQLGMSWSEPRVARVRANIGNTNNPENVVLIFGGGYDDVVEDINPCLLSSASTSAVVQKPIGSGSITYTAAGSCTITGATGGTTTFNRTAGRGIVVVDAFDGTVIWQASGAVSTSSAARARKLRVPDMTCAIPSDTSVVDRNRDGLADRVYVGDTCGQVWRLDISSASMDEWTATKIAALSSTTATDIANKRKFLFPPDLVLGTDANGTYTAVLIGSGDREHPFDTTVVNRFYMIKDRDSPSGNPVEGALNSSSVSIAAFATAPTGAVVTDGDVFDATTTALISGTDPLGLNGWKITLAPGEKVVSSATSVAGTVFFNTNQPSATAGGGACGSNLGIAREYLVGFADAAATTDVNGVGGITIADRSTEHAGGGYLPSPVPVVVEIDGKKYQAVISGTSVQTPPGLTLEKRTRSYWYKQID